MHADESGNPLVHHFQTSPVFLPESKGLRRLPRHPKNKRSAGFYAAFEDRALFYDCFQTDGGEVVLVGPPPLNLAPALGGATFRTAQSGRLLTPSWFPSRSTMVTVLNGAPSDTRAIQMELQGHIETIVVQQGRSALLKDRRVMFTMNKDNDLAWIEFWARWHAEIHGIDAVVIFDNGSTNYQLDAILETMAKIKPLRVVGLIDWPFRYGPVDEGVLTHPYWANFLQVASFSLMMRDIGRQSAGVLNCDIDELVGRVGDKGVFETLAASLNGFVKLKGTWIEAVGLEAQREDLPVSHLEFEFKHRNPLRARCANKWVLDPKRAWTLPYSIFPMMHRIYGMPREVAKAPPTHPFWHFRGINTNWKEQRVGPKAPPALPWLHKRDTKWSSERLHYLAAAASRED